ncbi:AraC family transcriptional regulator [Pokkaliibacter plantistimulans]|uniref:AraC family transcriptional regulator n=1 Tax=Proteobacteria bacterium 228 TaxID=2083153 RepID=A0A2S5KT20_9PROT|nr:AraC family transcriptional regulator [Pokkaliibacter plantistimulans]PPC78001.1 AraC family transcriptional regulator [Pokkaliibacter plantistimulans]
MEQARFIHAVDVGGLELLQATYERQRFSRHSHEGYTIGVIECGAQRFFRNGSNHVASQDCLIIVNADEVHDGHAASEGGWSYQAIYPLPAVFAELSDELQLGGLPYFRDSVIHDPLLARQLRQLFRLLAAGQGGNSLQRQALMMDAMAQLMLRHGGQRRSVAMLQEAPLAVQRVRDYIDAHCQDNLGIETLAAIAGLNPFYLTRLFQRTVGLPPHTYQLQQRIALARRLILQGMALRDVAQQAGFVDQSHLNRCFKRIMGVTPGRYGLLPAAAAVLRD